MLIQIFDRLFDRNVGLGELRIAVVTNDPSHDGAGLPATAPRRAELGVQSSGTWGSRMGKLEARASRLKKVAASTFTTGVFWGVLRP